MRQDHFKTLSLCILAVSLAVSGCDLLGFPGALTLASGERVNADELVPNARPRIDRQRVGVMYEGSGITGISHDTYVDAESVYLLIQVQRGWTPDLYLQERQPFEIRKFVGFDTPPESIPLPRNIEPLGDAIVEGCQFVDTVEVGMVAIQCDGEVAIWSPDAQEWSYIADPGVGEPTYVGSRSLFFHEDPSGATEFPVVYIDGQRRPLAELPAAFGTVEEHWVGPWDGSRARVLYRPDLLHLCAAVWTIADDTVREDGCLEFAVPGARPLSAGHIGGSVDGTVFFAGGENNTKEYGDDFLANVKPGSIEIVGRTTDRGNTVKAIYEDLGGPQIDNYLTTTAVKAGTGANAQDYTFYEIFRPDGTYDFTGEIIGSLNPGEPSVVCPDGVALLECRAYNIGGTREFTRVSETRVWRVQGVVYDARRRILVQPQDILLGSEREISTTIDPNRVIDEYVPLSPVVRQLVLARRVPGTFTGTFPNFADLSECATVTTGDGTRVEPDSLNYFPINILDTHTIELSDCQPDDAGPTLNDLVVEARPLVDVPYLNEQAPGAWNMEGVVFTRGAPLPITADTAEVIGGSDGAMIIATDAGWSLIETPDPGGIEWTSTVLASPESPAPRFIGDRRHIALGGGSVYGMDAQTEVATLAGVVDPAELLALAHGDLLAHDTPQGLAIWSTAAGAPSMILDRSGARSASLLDASDGAQHLLERDGDIVRVIQTSAARQADLVDLAGDDIEAAHISADGSRVLLRTSESGRITMTIYQLSDPTASSWTVASEVLTTLASAYQFRRATGEVFYHNDVAPGQPDYRAYMIYGTDGQSVAVTSDSVRTVAADALGNLLWFDPQERLKRMSWDDRVVEDVAFPVFPESSLDPGFYTEDEFVRAVAWGDWYYYDEAGELERASRRSTYPLSGDRAVYFATPESNVDNGTALWAGVRGFDTDSILDAYEAAIFNNPSDQLRAFNLLFAAHQDDGAFLRAPCMPYRIDTPQADYVTTPLPIWYCAR